MSGLWRQRLVLLVLCLALAGCARSGGVSDAPEVPEPQAGVDVQSITLDLRVDPATLELAGRAALRVQHPSGLGTLDLGLGESMTVDLVRVNRQPVQVQREANALRVPVSGDSSLVEIVYGGVPTSGVFRREEGGSTVVWTDGWPTRTAGWLPGVHHPSDPVVLDLTLQVPSAWEIVASGTPLAESVDGGWRRGRFVTPEAAPLYTLAWAAADFAITEQAGSVPIRHLTLARDSAAVSQALRTPAILDTLAAMLGPLPYGRFATVEVPLLYAGMENAAAPFFQTQLYETPGDLEEVIVHEAVHQWWGNDVVPADWRHLWLAEGPATYLTAVLYERLDGRDAFRQQLVRMALLSTSDARRALVPGPLAAPQDALSATVYQKGGTFLHILRQSIGDEAFFRGLRATLAAYDDAPLATAGFQSEMETASGRDLDALFAAWAYGSDLPTLRTKWDRATNTLSWELEGARGLGGIGLELYVKQGGASGVYVPLDSGVVSLAGDGHPEVFPVGWLATIQR